jgi:hypothetical protein
MKRTFGVFSTSLSIPLPSSFTTAGAIALFWFFCDTSSRLHTYVVSMK